MTAVERLRQRLAAKLDQQTAGAADLLAGLPPATIGKLNRCLRSDDPRVVRSLNDDALRLVLGLAWLGFGVALQSFADRDDACDQQHDPLH
ncbi:MAG: hypothetical protein WBC44_04625 [Planctomycetaceae bacterium]